MHNHVVALLYQAKVVNKLVDILVLVHHEVSELVIRCNCDADTVVAAYNTRLFVDNKLSCREYGEVSGVSISAHHKNITHATERIGESSAMIVLVVKFI